MRRAVRVSGSLTATAGAPVPGAGPSRLIVGLALLAAVLCSAVGLVSHDGLDAGAILVLATLIAGGELAQIDVRFRRGGAISYSLGDTALTAGFLTLPGSEVLVAGALAIIVLQLTERMPLRKQLFNAAQSLAGFAAAALVMELLAPRPGPVDPLTLLAAAIGMGVLSLINSLAVGGMIALTDGEPWWVVVRRLLPTATLLLFGNLCMGLLVVLLLDTNPWALPAVGLPMALLLRATRAEVRAEVGRSRAQAFSATEQRMSEASSPAAVSTALVGGVCGLLGLSAAVWAGDRWVTPVPPRSGPCLVDPGRTTAVEGRSRELGPAVDGDGAGIGLGHGALVVWGGGPHLDEDSREWLERLARSGRLHVARAAAAQTLALEQATLRAVVDGTADGICVLDETGGVRLWNPAMVALSQATAQRAIGRPAAEILGQGPWTADGVHDVTRAGDRVWRVSVSCVDDPSAGALRVGVVHDISAERRIARMKDDMLAVVSHELRTPLTPIKAAAQLLLLRWDRVPAEQRCELLSQVISSADHLNRLVDDLLLVAQLSDAATAAPPIALAATDLAAFVRDCVASLRIALPDHVLDIDADDAVPGLTDPARLRQIVESLVSNACKFSPPGSAVQIGLTAQGEHAVLTIADHGRGIAAQDLERVFERFERVEDPLVMTTSGAGLGLPIVRGLAHALGGEVRLASAVGLGTTATVVLPLLRHPLADAASPRVRPGDAPR